VWFVLLLSVLSVFAIPGLTLAKLVPTTSHLRGDLPENRTLWVLIWKVRQIFLNVKLFGHKKIC